MSQQQNEEHESSSITSSHGVGVETTYDQTPLLSRRHNLNIHVRDGRYSALRDEQERFTDDILSITVKRLIVGVEVT